jgi:2-oxoglutarate ferredoxin oxidoreductase subunit delta
LDRSPEPVSSGQRGEDAPQHEARRYSRKTFLGVAATAFAGVALIAATLHEAGSGVETTDNSVSSSGLSSSSPTDDAIGQSSQSQASGGLPQDDSAGQSTTTQIARVLVDESRCVGCGACLRACPSGVFALDSGGSATAVAPDACTFCGHCVQVCRPEAITLNA